VSVLIAISIESETSGLIIVFQSTCKSCLENFSFQIVWDFCWRNCSKI